jgi:hypothetical protein
MGLSRLVMGLFIIACYLGGNVCVGMELALKNSLRFNNYTYFIVNSMFLYFKENI